MIKLKTEKHIVLGLSDINMEKLKQGLPILFKLRELGNEFPDVEVMIFNGRTEPEMQKMFMELVVPGETVIKDNYHKKNQD